MGVLSGDLFEDPQATMPEPSENQIRFWVPGIPAPAGSKKGFYNKKKNRVFIVDDCSRNKPWQTDVKAFGYQAYRGPVLTGPVHVCVFFYMPRPKGHYGTGHNMLRLKESAPLYPTSAPDTTKLFRSVEDALTGLIWKDDAQVVIQFLRKFYAGEKGPGADIAIQEILT